MLVGIGTVLTDDPSLTVRLLKGENPQRIIVDGRLRIPLETKILNDEEVDKTIIVTTEGANREKAQRLRNLGVEVLWAAKNQRGEVDMADLLKQLGRMGITSVLVEGGAKIITSLIRERLADKIVVVVAPKLIGEGIEAVGNLEIHDLSKALRISGMKTRRLGEDMVIEGYLEKVKS